MKCNIKHEKSAPYSPHQNGSAERAWRPLFEMARYMIFETNLPTFLQAYAVMCAACTRNRCYNSRIGKSALEAFSGRRPNVSHMHVLGKVCYAYVKNRKKLDAGCEQGIIVGYDRRSPAYLVYLPESLTVKRVKYVNFSSK